MIKRTTPKAFALAGAFALITLLALLGSLGSAGSAKAAISSILDDGSNSSGWTNDVHIKAGAGNPGDAFTFGKNELISHDFGSTGADFSGATIKFDVIFNASSDYLGLWWGHGLGATSGISNGLYMGPAGNPTSSNGSLAGHFGLIPNFTYPCMYYCVGSSPSSTFSWDPGQWYEVEVKISATSTSYYVDGQFVQSIATTLPAANFVTFGGDDRNGWGFSDGVYLDNVSITPAPFRTIAYDVNGSTSPAPIQADVLENASFIVADSVERDLYDFAGWSDGSNVYLPGDSYTVGATNITMAATWTKKTYPLEFYPEGGSAVASTTFNNVDAFVEPAPPTRPGFTFYGWSRTAAGSPLGSQDVFTETSSLTLHALWSSDATEVVFDSNGGSTVATVALEIGTSIQTAPADPVRAGYNFEGWQTSPGSGAVSFPYSPVLTVGNPQAVTSAGLTDDGSYVNVGRWNANTWYGPQRPQSHPRDVVTFKDGLKFVAIRENINAVLQNPERPDGYYLIPLADSITLTASWSAIAHQVNYSVAGGTSSAPTQADVLTDGSFTVAAAATRRGYVFAGWSDGTTSYQAGAVYSVGATDVTLTAQWSVISHQVTYALANGYGTAPTQAAVATDGSFTVATNPTRAGYTFAGWSDGSAVYQAGDQYVVSDSDVTLTATWTQNPTRTITFSAGGGAGSYPGSVPSTLLAGESFELPVNPYSRDGFDFAGWSDGTTVHPAGMTILIGANDLTFVAVWTEKVVTVTHGNRNYIISGFKFEKSDISTAMYSKLRSWLNANRNVTEVTCTGYTGFNQNKLTPAQLAKLGKDRAVHVCNYLKKLRPSLVTKLAKPVASTSKNSAMRRVVILGKY